MNFLRRLLRLLSRFRRNTLRVSTRPIEDSRDSISQFKRIQSERLHERMR